eukprot:TRINITY_DN31920_c0_g1_i1.p1 TRINITY_DN31920_c0_g1~~TRINITY_DN31920_c0_g1_i1.p1  ORF type:complete len:216 (+),score=29.37 TRINITY_DN31920_c0_g1_i1:363-1010(+)
MVHFGSIDIERHAQLSQAVTKKYGININGVPSLHMVSPGSLVAREYNGERKAKALKSAAFSYMPSYVQQMAEAKLDTWLEKDRATSRKAILFSSKSSVPPLFKAISSQYRGLIEFAQITIADLAASKAKPLVDRFSLAQLPTLIVLKRDADDFEDAKWLESKFGGKQIATLTFGKHEKPSFRNIEGWLMGYGRLPRSSPKAATGKRKPKKDGGEL